MRTTKHREKRKEEGAQPKLTENSVNKYHPQKAGKKAFRKAAGGGLYEQNFQGCMEQSEKQLDGGIITDLRLLRMPQ